MSQGSTAVGVGVVRVAVLSDTIKSVAFVALLVLLFLVNYLVPWVGGRHFLGQSLGFWRVAAWLVTLAIAIACFLLVGLWTKGRVIGILIDNRNMVSLSACAPPLQG